MLKKLQISRQGRAGQDRAGQGRAGQGRAGQGRAGQGRAGQGRAGQDRTGQDMQPMPFLSTWCYPLHVNLVQLESAVASVARKLFY